MFLELCALSTSGELTEDEQKNLNAHLLVCATCREAIKQYESLVAHEIPTIAANEAAETAEHIDPGQVDSRPVRIKDSFHSCPRPDFSHRA
jgi:hypothetical protein